MTRNPLSFEDSNMVNMDARAIIEAIFPGRGFGTKLPPTACAITKLEGITVMVITSATARVWRKTMRVYGFCPRCHKRFSFSRLKQHMPACQSTGEVMKCWDCGSTIPKHHTTLCEMAEADAVRDLPSVPGTQWWTEAAK
jgi:RecJ-like exonuclease